MTKNNKQSRPFSLADVSIRNQLVLLMLLISLVSLLAAALGNIWLDRRDFEVDLRESTAQLAAAIGQNNHAALLFNDAETAKESLDTFHNITHIKSAAIYDKEGALFASYLALQEDQRSPDAVPMPLGTRFQEDRLVHVSEITLKDGLLGYIYLVSGTEHWRQTQIRNLGVLLTFYGSVFLVGLVLASQLQNVITRPLASLLETIFSIRAHRDYSIRARSEGSNEIGRLIDGFNELIAEIESNRQELASLNRDLEAKVIQRNQDLEDLAQARDAAEAAARAKSTFLANMSHEIRTPMNAILGFAQILEQDESIAGASRKQVSYISKACDHLLSLINEILDLSKLEARGLELDPEPLDLYEFLDGLCAIFAARCESAGLQWRYEAELPDPCIVLADRNKLAQVLVNFLGNAAKFTDSGHVLLRVSREDARTEFVVEDSGKGIEIAQQEIIFQPFRQGSAGTSRQGGSGLGLSIANGLVRLMGGEIELRSQPGRGSRFSFTVDLPATNETPRNARSAVHPAARLAEGEHVKALIVDDIVSNREMLKALLARAGIAFEEVENGQEALDYLAGSRVDIVFMDIAMPVLDGYETARLLREQHGADCPVLIAISASGFVSDREAYIARGFADFLPKPYPIGDLLGIVEKHLQVRFEAPRRKPDSVQDVPQPESVAPVPVPDELCQRLSTAIRLKRLRELHKLLEELRQLPGGEALAELLQTSLDALDFEQLQAQTEGLIVVEKGSSPS